MTPRINDAASQVLVDSDAFVGWLYAADAHYQAANRIFDEIKQQKLTPITTSFVVMETATVLSHRQGQKLARIFLELADKTPTIHITQEIQHEGLALFRTQDARGTSVVDCTNVVIMRRFNIPKIFSFDQVYTKTFGLKIA